jgi:hypothetical protein
MTLFLILLPWLGILDIMYRQRQRDEIMSKFNQRMEVHNRKQQALEELLR